MAIEEQDLDLIVTEAAQRTAVLDAIKKLNQGAVALRDLDAWLDNLVASGSFNTLPAAVKAVLNRYRLVINGAWNEIKDDPELAVVFGWSP